MDHTVERFDLMVDHHEAEFKSLMKWQVAMQSSMDDLIRQQKIRDKQIDERIDAIGALVRSVPKAGRGGEAGGEEAGT